MREEQRTLDQINSWDFSAFKSICNKPGWSKEFSKRLEVEGLKFDWVVVKLHSEDFEIPVKVGKRFDKVSCFEDSKVDESEAKGWGGNLLIKLVSNLIELDLWKDEEWVKFGLDCELLWDSLIFDFRGPRSCWTAVYKKVMKR